MLVRTHAPCSRMTDANTPHLRTFIFVSLLALMVCLPSAGGQVLTGQIDGAVQDSSGAVVPNATITITNSGENLVQRVVKAGEHGDFTAPLLSVGTYSVTVSASGFKAFTVKNVDVHVGSPVTIPVTLTVGQVSEDVTVTAAVLGAQLDNAAAGTLIESQQVVGLSLSSRNYLQLMYIQPGISSGVPGPDDRGNITTSGQVNTQTFSVNGNERRRTDTSSTVQTR
jgi:hypothetical protein